MKIDLSKFDGMTPGKWAVDDRFITTLYVVPEEHLGRKIGFAVDPINDQEEYAQQILYVRPDKHSRGDYKANARAIAALPDLIDELRRTREALDIALEYLDDRQDVNWEGNAGNDAMRCLQEINEAMGER